MADVAPPLIDFSPIGDLYNVYRQTQQKAARERVLGQLGQGSGPLDYSQASRALLAAGDTEGGMSLARLAQQQYVTSPEHAGAIAEATAKVAEKYAPKTTNIKTAAGDELTVEKTSTGYRLPKIEGQPDTPNNPFAFGKQNESQSKDSGYADRMFRAESVLRDPKVEEAATSLKENMLGKAPGFISNYLTGPDFQKFDQAKRDFVNAVLRRESGAAISQSEFDNAHKQYFAQPGDTPERIAEKKRNRQDAIAGVAGGGGPSYKPPYAFGPNGDLVPSGAPPRGTVDPNAWKNKDTITAARANKDGALQEARDAISKGAPRDAVVQRLKQVGIDPSGL